MLESWYTGGRLKSRSAHLQTILRMVCAPCRELRAMPSFTASGKVTSVRLNAKRRLSSVYTQLYNLV